MARIVSRSCTDYKVSCKNITRSFIRKFTAQWVPGSWQVIKCLVFYKSTQL